MWPASSSAAAKLHASLLKTAASTASKSSPPSPASRASPKSNPSPLPANSLSMECGGSTPPFQNSALPQALHGRRPHIQQNAAALSAAPTTRLHHREERLRLA